MLNRTGWLSVAVAIALSMPVALPQPVAAQTQAAAAAAPSRTDGIRVGMLRCDAAGDVAFVVGSTRALVCDFSTPQGAHERYVGEIDRFGVDLGFRQSAVMIWAVLAQGPDIRPGSLAGTYGGVSAEAAFVGGAGVNVLTGGSTRSISLQPVSIEGEVGLNLAAGITTMTLKPAS